MKHEHKLQLPDDIPLLGIELTRLSFWALVVALMLGLSAVLGLLSMLGLTVLGWMQ